MSNNVSVPVTSDKIISSGNALILRIRARRAEFREKFILSKMSEPGWFSKLFGVKARTREEAEQLAVLREKDANSTPIWVNWGTDREDRAIVLTHMASHAQSLLLDYESFWQVGLAYSEEHES